MNCNVDHLLNGGNNVVGSVGVFMDGFYLLQSPCFYGYLPTWYMYTSNMQRYVNVFVVTGEEIICVVAVILLVTALWKRTDNEIAERKV